MSRNGTVVALGGNGGTSHAVTDALGRAERGDTLAALAELSAVGAPKSALAYVCFLRGERERVTELLAGEAEDRERSCLSAIMMLERGDAATARDETARVLAADTRTLQVNALLCHLACQWAERGERRLSDDVLALADHVAADAVARARVESTRAFLECVFGDARAGLLRLREIGDTFSQAKSPRDAFETLLRVAMVVAGMPDATGGEVLLSLRRARSLADALSLHDVVRVRRLFRRFGARFVDFAADL
jgi:hypothetical protein